MPWSHIGEVMLYDYVYNGGVAMIALHSFQFFFITVYHSLILL